MTQDQICNWYMERADLKNDYRMDGYYSGSDHCEHEVWYENGDTYLYVEDSADCSFDNIVKIFINGVLVHHSYYKWVNFGYEETEVYYE